MTRFQSFARRTTAVSVLIGLIVGAVVLLAVGTRDAVYEARVGLIASPVTENPGAGAAQYGEVVSLVLPALVELARSPSVLAEATKRVKDAPPATDLAKDISVELVPASGLARLSVRASSADAAGKLVHAVAGAMIDTNLLRPVSTLRLLDEQADINQVAPDWPLVIGMALAAAVVAGIGVAVFLKLRRAQDSEDDVREVLSAVGSSTAAIVRRDDPKAVDRLSTLCAAAARRVRVVAVTPELIGQAVTLGKQLGTAGVMTPDAAVIAVTERGRRDELAATVGILPERAVLVAVVVA